MASPIAKTKTGIGRQAEIVDRPGLFEVKLYATYIYSEEGNITLNHGGWVTQTTARYMNQALSYRGQEVRVFIKGGEMFWKSAFGNPQPFFNGVAVIAKAVA
jgi:hypothetical protein